MNLCMLTDCPLSAEALKSAQIPVPGAVVIAPLTESVRNYGSLGGSFTVVGAPVLGANGATFDGSDDALLLTTGYTGDYTLVARCQINSATFDHIMIHAMCGIATDSGAYGCGFGNRGNAPFLFMSLRNGSTSGTVAGDTGVHTITITEGVAKNVYIDGVLIATMSGASPSTHKPGLCLGSYSTGIARSLYCSGILANLSIFPSVLSAPDRAAVEAYVAAP